MLFLSLQAKVSIDSVDIQKKSILVAGKESRRNYDNKSFQRLTLITNVYKYKTDHDGNVTGKRKNNNMIIYDLYKQDIVVEGEVLWGDLLVKTISQHKTQFYDGRTINFTEILVPVFYDKRTDVGLNVPKVTQIQRFEGQYDRFDSRPFINFENLRLLNSDCQIIEKRCRESIFPKFYAPKVYVTDYKSLLSNIEDRPPHHIPQIFDRTGMSLAVPGGILMFVLLLGYLGVPALTELSVLGFFLSLFVYFVDNSSTELKRSQVAKANSVNLFKHNTALRKRNSKLVKLKEIVLFFHAAAYENFEDAYLHYHSKLEWERLVSIENPQKGLSEDVFFDKLKLVFGDAIHRNLAKEISEGYYYYPDFVFYDVNSGVLIDIEIDEPYSFHDGTVIHSDHEDTTRNDAFVNDHWLVLRFSERQVVLSPIKCIEAILSVVTAETKNVSMCYDQSIEENGWTLKQGSTMKNEGYRESYLGLSPKVWASQASDEYDFL